MFGKGNYMLQLSLGNLPYSENKWIPLPSTTRLMTRQKERVKQTPLCYTLSMCSLLASKFQIGPENNLQYFHSYLSVNKSSVFAPVMISVI